VLTLCPPGPEEQKVSIAEVLGFDVDFGRSSASGSTATVIAEVWTRPLLLCSGYAPARRWVPDSYFMRL